jgi:hypothetical protein
MIRTDPGGCPGARDEHNGAVTQPSQPAPETTSSLLAGFGPRSRPLIVEARVDPAQYEAQF